MTRPTTHPTHTEAVADAAASSMTGHLLTPCCGVPISAYVSGFSEEIEIYCPAGDCASTWNDDGKKES